MAKKKSVANKNNIEIPGATPVVDDSYLPKKDTFTPDEVSAYFGVARSTIYLWISHGLFPGTEKYTEATMRIPRKSILSFRLKSRLDSLA